MTSLADIGPQTEEVDIRGKKFLVAGISAEGLFYLITTFQEFRSLMEGKSLTTLDPSNLASMGAKAIGGVIAVSLVDRELFSSYRQWVVAVHKEQELARKMPAPIQLKLLNAIFRCTFEEGAGPFVDQIKALVKTLGVEDMVKAVQVPTATPSSPKQSETQEAATPQQQNSAPSEALRTTLPGRSHDSFLLDTPGQDRRNLARGVTPPVN